MSKLEEISVYIVDVFKLCQNISYISFEASLNRGLMLKEWLLEVLDSQDEYFTYLFYYLFPCIFCLIATFWYYARKRPSEFHEKRSRVQYNTKHFMNSKGINEKLKSYVYEVHRISASLDPSAEELKHCIMLLNHIPSLINHPMPPYNFTPFLRACWSGNTPLVRYMLQNGADLQSCTLTQETPFYLAAYRVTKTKLWDPSVIQLLYKAGCDLGTVNVKGSSALHLAAHAGHTTLTRWLLAHGAHHTLPHTKVTPYDIAIKHRDVNHQSIASLLHTFCPEMVPGLRHSF